MAGLFVAGAGSAAEALDGITVTASGRAEAAPRVLRVAFRVDGAAEMGGDALTKFRDQRTRVLEAVDALAVPGLIVRPGSVTVGQTAARPAGNRRVVVNGVVQNQSGSEGSFDVSEVMTVDMPAGETALDEVARLYDLGRDLGVSFRPPVAGGPLVQPVSEDAAALDARAAAAAFETARAKAAATARTAGVTLGPVLSVEVVEAASPRGTAGGTGGGGDPAAGGSGDPMAAGGPAPAGSVLSVRVELKVRFALK